MERYIKSKDKDKDIYYWVDGEGVYKKDHDTATPDLDSYEVVE